MFRLIIEQTIKPHLLFSNLFIVALVLLSPVTKAKTKPHNSIKKSFPTGTFVIEPTVGMIPNPDTNSDQKWIDAPPIPKNSKEYNLFKNILSIKKIAHRNNYKVSFHFSNWFSGKTSECDYSGIFEQKTKDKSLTLINKEKKYGCADITIGANKRTVVIIGKDSSCSQFCANTSEMYFEFPIK